MKYLLQIFLKALLLIEVVRGANDNNTVTEPQEVGINSSVKVNQENIPTNQNLSLLNNSESQKTPLESPTMEAQKGVAVNQVSDKDRENEHIHMNKTIKQLDYDDYVSLDSINSSISTTQSLALPNYTNLPRNLSMPVQKLDIGKTLKSIAKSKLFKAALFIVSQANPFASTAIKFIQIFVDDGDQMEDMKKEILNAIDKQTEILMEALTKVSEQVSEFGELQKAVQIRS